MSRDNPRSDETLQPLLEAFEKLEECGLPRPAVASWNEYLATLVSLDVLPHDLAERIVSEYHRRRFSGMSHDDSGLRQTLEALDGATQEFASLDSEKRGAVAAALNEQFRPTEHAPPLPIETETPARPALSVNWVEEKLPAPAPSDPREVLAVPNLSHKGFGRRLLIWGATAVVLCWTFGVLAGGYIAHDRIEQWIANFTNGESDDPIRRTDTADERHVAREDWSAVAQPNARRSHHAEVLQNIARTYDRQDQVREAIYAYHLLTKEQPRNALALNNLAYLLLITEDKSLQDPARALELAERAVSLERSAANIDTLAEAVFQNGDPVTAAILGARAIRAPGHESDIKYLRAQLQRFTREAWKKATTPQPAEATPDFVASLNALRKQVAEQRMPRAKAVAPVEAQRPVIVKPNLKLSVPTAEMAVPPLPAE